MEHLEKNPVAVVSEGAIKFSYPQHNKKIVPTQGKTYQEVNEAALPLLASILYRWLPDGLVRGHEYMSRNPKRADNKAGSFKINTLTGRWADFATGDAGGDIISLAAYLFSLSQQEAKQRIAEMIGGRHAQ